MEDYDQNQQIHGDRSDFTLISSSIRIKMLSEEHPRRFSRTSLSPSVRLRLARGLKGGTDIGRSRGSQEERPPRNGRLGDRRRAHQSDRL